MDLLILLLERKGALVTREEIASSVWSEDGLVDTQSSINTAIRKIRQALGDDGEKPRFVETVVGKGYRFIGEVSTRIQPPEQLGVEAPLDTKPPTVAVPVVGARPRTMLFALAGIAAAALGVAVFLLPGLSPHKTEPLRIVPFTAVPGIQAWPAFSPDGNDVAFAWSGETGTCSHLYVKAATGGPYARLTDGPDCDSHPSWSRDGRSIAFLRRQGEGHVGLYLIPARGGKPRRIGVTNGPDSYRPAWTKDGTALLVMHREPPDEPPSLFRIAIDSGEMSRITKAVPGSTGDWCPAYSPDGRMLALLRNTGSRRLSPLYVVPVDARGMPSGNPRKIETGSAGFVDFDWSADGHSLVATTPSGLVRVPLSGGVIEPLPFPDGAQATVAPRGNRMVYVRPFHDADIFRVPGPEASGPVTRLISSTREERAPQYSRDGRRIVFVTNRTGAEEIWVTNSDGNDPRQITSFGGPSVGSPRWSPDGKWIAFDSTADGRAAIYVIAADGGAASRITTNGISAVRPSWSRDGRWIYFASNTSGEWEIWKTNARGAAPVQVTQDGGREAFEAPGGEFLYYTKAPPAEGIWRISLKATENPTARTLRVTESGSQGRWAMGNRGLYYLKGPDELVFQDFADMRCVRLATPGLRLGEGFPNMIGSAPDDRWILLTVTVRSEGSLTLVQNFR